MSKYLPNNNEMRIAIFTAIATILLVLVGSWVLRIAHMTSDKGMMHKMPNGSMMMNDGKMEMGDNMNDMDMMDMTMNNMAGMLEGKTGKALEKEFIVGMIPHHQGAVDMAKVLLNDKTISAEMKKFAEDIIRAQEGEIKMMNDWLKKYQLLKQ